MDDPKEKKEKPKRRVFRKFFKYFSLLILLVLIVSGAAIYWLTQTEGGQKWLVAELNGLLGPAPDKEGLAFKITRLEGSLPFDFRLGLQLYDRRGLWLVAPDNRLNFNWRDLPGALTLVTLAANDVDMTRLPDLPASLEPPQPTEPFGINELRGLLNDAGEFLKTKHWWLPKINIEDVRAENFLLPAGLLPMKEGRPRVDAYLTASLADGELKLDAQTGLKNAAGEAVKITDFSFDALRASLNVTAAPKDDGLGATLALQTDVDNPLIKIEDIPENFLGEKIELKLNVDAEGGMNGAKVAVSGPGLDAGILALKGEGRWQSGSAWKKGALDGPFAYGMNVNVDPVTDAPETSPLAILKSPLSLDIKADGDLPKLAPDVKLACAELEKSGHKVANLSLDLRSREIDLPVDSGKFDLLENENDIDLVLAATVDGDPVNLSTRAFFKALKGENAEASPEVAIAGWLAGARDLKLSALGIELAGDVAATLRDGEKPELTGSLKMDARKWEAINKFIPGQTISGVVTLAAKLDPAANGQSAKVELNVPNLKISPAEGKPTAITNANLNAEANDIFNAPAIALTFKADKITAAGMNFKADAKVKGPISGPIDAEVNADGDARAAIAATWSPGIATLKKLEAGMNMPPLSGSGAKTRLGVKTIGQTRVTYGEKGVSVDRLEADITPSGKLRASGGFAPDKLDFSLSLASLNFKPWQNLVPALPAGSADVNLKLNGAPARPGGSFKVDLNKIVVPNLALPPVTLALAGGIERGSGGSALRARLEVDKSTLKALGASVAAVTASLPLTFGADGVPSPSMDGPLAAKVRWEGAIGPIWNLLPIADQRLNGRLDIDIGAGGTLKAPRVQGGVKVNQARYENLLLGVLLTDINADVTLTQDGGKAPVGGLSGAMNLKLNLSDGRGGSVAVNGKGSLDGSNLDIRAKIDRLKPLRRRDVFVELSGGADVTGSATSPDVKGEIIVNQGEILLDNLDIAGSVTTLPITDPGAKKAEKKEAKKEEPAKAAQGPGRLNVRVNMLPRFKIDGRGLASTWKANLLIIGPINNPQITGNVSAVQGNFDFLGKNFGLTQGTVTFAGGSIANPLLDIELTNETPDLTAHILVTGPVDKMKLTMTSDPTLPRDEILSRVLFGRSVNDLSKMEMLQLAGAVAQLAGFGGGGGIMNFAKKALGVDVLRVGTSASNAAGEPGDQTAGGTTIEMGKYINDMIYVGVQQGMQPDSTAFIIQMELTPRTNLEVRTERNNTWGGIKWKYDY